ncbi:hydroxysteroid 11-beta-dehydrogenase 1-like protein isoform X1 [Acanthaster planci]|uniref:Hydroxysteroid 11-beta-dehydrogenase 1-like protein isoform X1 n=1 Tax=Acanthaster planci TaxID=133434 RepID=A0A8B7XUL7_ACAPL|nr:hydroxysteroid 11-beta-dehydrogenase 1-like protein isoform X1 [Acanthaster planci]
MGWKTFVAIGIAAYLIYHSIDQFDPASVKDKRVVITGASTGIGEEIAYHYARFGARILITARRESVLKEVVAKCKELGAKEVFYIPLDMAKEEAPKILIDEAEKKFRGLDHLILNHIISSYPKFWDGEFDSVMKKTMEVNFFAYIRLATHATPMLRESKGHIGVVSSGAGKIGLPFVAIYSASKFALHGFFDALRQEYKMQNFGISISTFVLGGINTTNVAKDTTKIFLEQTFYTTPSDTALRIIKGTTNREREVYYPYFPITKMRDFAPELMERIVQSQTLNHDTIKKLLTA